ncbi:MAG: response regulator [Leptonema sp. (in: Bacteria)]|nr:response regulator [Leptonema sp. (in: bacteria)]
MKVVLDVGQCRPDHIAISKLIESVGASIERIALSKEAVDLLKQKKYDLVLVNRKIDKDYTDGVELVKMMQADPELKSIPVMLVSNYPEAQQDAVQLGAVMGFGKNALSKPETAERLKQALNIK